jgi:hypothetical protein
MVWNFIEKHKLAFILLMMLCQVIALAIIGLNTAWSVEDRKQIHREFEEIKRQTEINDERIDALERK